MDTREILEKVKRGEISVEEAEGFFRREPFEELGYAKLDFHREVRTSFPEVIFCSGKPDQYLVSIYQKMVEATGRAFGTRATQEQYELVKKVLPQAIYDPVSRILKVEPEGGMPEGTGMIAICSGGTADVPVAEEAAQTAEYFGAHDPESKLHRRRRRYGRSTRERARRPREQSGDRSSDVSGIRREHARPVRAPHNDQLLRKRHRRRQHRQRLRRGLRRDAD